MVDVEHLMRVMGLVASSLESPTDLEQTRQRITAAGCDAVEGAEFASMTARDVATGHVETVASTHPVLYEIDRLQYELGEGPCFDAVTEEELSVSPDLLTDSRWPNFGPRAAALGMRSQLGVRLRDDNPVMGLNLYSRKPHAFEEPLDDVRVVAAQARAILGYARENDTLARGLESRTTIGQAIGIVMERYGLDDKAAFHFLVRVSQDSNVKLREVAEHIVRPEPE